MLVYLWQIYCVCAESIEPQTYLEITQYLRRFHGNGLQSVLLLFDWVHADQTLCYVSRLLDYITWHSCLWVGMKHTVYD